MLKSKLSKSSFKFSVSISRLSSSIVKILLSLLNWLLLVSESSTALIEFIKLNTMNMDKNIIRILEICLLVLIFLPPILVLFF